MSYFFSEAARAEHLEQVSYYEERRAGLGTRYLAAFDATMARICKHPERFPIEHDSKIRRIRIPGFPSASCIASSKARLKYWPSQRMRAGLDIG